VVIHASEGLMKSMLAYGKKIAPTTSIEPRTSSQCATHTL